MTREAAGRMSLPADSVKFGSQWKSILILLSLVCRSTRKSRKNLISASSEKKNTEEAICLCLGVSFCMPRGDVIHMEPLIASGRFLFVDSAGADLEFGTHPARCGEKELAFHRPSRSEPPWSLWRC